MWFIANHQAVSLEEHAVGFGAVLCNEVERTIYLGRLVALVDNVHAGLTAQGGEIGCGIIFRTSGETYRYEQRNGCKLELFKHNCDICYNWYLMLSL